MLQRVRLISAKTEPKDMANDSAFSSDTNRPVRPIQYELTSFYTGPSIRDAVIYICCFKKHKKTFIQYSR